MEKYLKNRIKHLEEAKERADNNGFNKNLSKNERNEHRVRMRNFDWGIYELKMVLEKYENEHKNKPFT